MNLSELRQWFFEIFGILLPGAATVFLTAVFCLHPSEFGTHIPSPPELTALWAPLTSQTLKVIALLSLAFVVGHLVQQLSVHLLQLHARLFRVRERSLIPEVFGNSSVQRFLLPSSSGFDPTAAGLTPHDYFMMVYPDLAPHTKRETFISLAGFSGAMALVTLLAVALIAAAAAIRLATGAGFFAAPVLAGTIGGIVLAQVWISRCSYFHSMADRVVVNYFLRSFGSSHRLQRDGTPSE